MKGPKRVKRNTNTTVTANTRYKDDRSSSMQSNEDPPTPTKSTTPATNDLKASADQDSSTCSCLHCMVQHPYEGLHATHKCRYPSCNSSVKYYGWNQWKLAVHEQGHFGKRGEYRCHEKYCPATTKVFPKWGELKRHAKTMHCKLPRVFFCDVMGCKYREIGFARKDKLGDHVRNVHTGKVVPGKANRPIKAAIGKKDRAGYTT